MSNSTKEIGNIGEAEALLFLQKSGYEILEKNWRSGSLEIDIICKKNTILCIIEVKTRKSNTLVKGYMAVNKKKQKNLILAATNYVKYRKLDLEVRFDIVTIEGDGDKKNIEHIENAFKPTW